MLFCALAMNNILFNLFNMWALTKKIIRLIEMSMSEDISTKINK